MAMDLYEGKALAEQNNLALGETGETGRLCCGKDKNTNKWAFSHVYETKGLYSYMSGHEYHGVAFFGYGGTAEQMTAELSPPMYRVKNCSAAPGPQGRLATPNPSHRVCVHSKHGEPDIGATPSKSGPSVFCYDY